MKVLCLGTGTLTTEIRANSSFFINNELLVDIGSGTLRQFHKYNCQTNKIKYLLITHFHSDHFFDIINLLIKRVLTKDNPLLTIIGPKNLKKRIKELFCLHADHSDDEKYDNLEKKYNIKIIEMTEENKKIEIDEYQISRFKAKHTILENINSYIIEYKNKSCCFTGDTTICDELIENISNCKNIFIDSNSLTTDEYHIGYDDVIKLSDKFSDCTFYPIHRGDYVCTDKRDNVIILEDGDIVKIK